MAVSLQKGGNVSLSKQAPGMKKVGFGLGWDAAQDRRRAFDLDASAFVLDAGGKVLSDQHFVFYNNAKDPSGAVSHKGDNRTGAGRG
jgi:tellurium resistance protein TerD